MLFRDPHPVEDIHFPKAFCLQKRICYDMDNHLFTVSLSSRSTDFRRRASELSDGIAKRFHQIVPSHPGLFMNDRCYTMISRHLLDLPTSDNMPPSCICGAALINNPSHFHSCPLMKGNSITSRHHKCIQVIQKYTQKAGGSFLIEPSDERGKRVDGIIVLTNVSLDVSFDFTVVHTSSPSYSSSSTSSLLDARANLKNGKYLQQSASEGRLFIPFVMSSYGVLHQAAIDLLWLISDCACSNGLAHSASSFFYPFVDELLVALHSGNAHISSSGLIAARRKQQISRAVQFAEDVLSHSSLIRPSSSSSSSFLSSSLPPSLISPSLSQLEQPSLPSSSSSPSDSPALSSSESSAPPAPSSSEPLPRLRSCLVCLDDLTSSCFPSGLVGCVCASMPDICNECIMRHLRELYSACPECKAPISFVRLSDGEMIPIEFKAANYVPDLNDDEAAAHALALEEEDISFLMS